MCFQDSFDFLLCIEAAASFENPQLFVEGAAHVLRKGGRLVLADAFDRKASIRILDVLEDNGVLEVNLAISCRQLPSVAILVSGCNARCFSTW